MGIGRLRLPFTIDVMFTWSNCYLATKSAARSLKKKEKKTIHKTCFKINPMQYQDWSLK